MERKEHKLMDIIVVMDTGEKYEPKRKSRALKLLYKFLKVYIEFD